MAESWSLNLMKQRRTEDRVDLRLLPLMRFVPRSQGSVYWNHMSSPCISQTLLSVNSWWCSQVYGQLPVAQILSNLIFIAVYPLHVSLSNSQVLSNSQAAEGYICCDGTNRYFKRECISFIPPKGLYLHKGRYWAGSLLCCLCIHNVI